MKKLSIQPGRELSWTRRPARGTPKKELLNKILSRLLEKEDLDYRFQANRLKNNFEELLRDHVNFPDRKYIRFILLPEENEIQEPLTEYFLERYSLEFISIESFGLHSLALFEPNDWNLFTEIFKNDLENFYQFANGGGSKTPSHEKRITLIHEFGLLIPSRVDFVARPLQSEKQLSVIITQVKENAVSNDFIYTCAATAGVRINVSEHGIIKETDILEQLDNNPISPQTFDAFIKELDKSVEIKAIYLDKMAVVDHINFDQKVTTNLPQIEDPPSGCPVICIIDSGVENNHYTEKALLPYEDDHSNGLSLDLDNNNPQQDSVGHGTSVACRILYGSTLDTNIVPTRKNLLPISRIYPIKLKSHNEDGKFAFPVRELFSDDGHLAQAVKEQGIKIINISVNKEFSDVLHFPDRRMSVEAAIIDDFSRKNKVLVVISTGNIQTEELIRLVQKDGTKFLEEIDSDSDAIAKYIRVLPPADFMSGISAGSGWLTDGKKFTPSWFTRCLPSLKGKSPNKPDCLAPGGDYFFQVETNPPVARNSPDRSVLTMQSYGHMGSDDHLIFMSGTSFSAPQIVRTLAIAQATYPEASTETIKGIFLHRSYSKKAKLRKLTDDTTPVPIEMLRAMGGASTMSEMDELKFLAGNHNGKKGEERTYAIEGEINHKKMISFDLPLTEVTKMMEGLEDHKLGIRLSVSYFPLLPSSYQFDEPIPFKEANQLHIAACLHSPDISPIQTEGKNPNQPIAMASSDWLEHGLVEWTMDYYGVIQNPFSTKEQKVSWKKFKDKIGKREYVQLSLRCFINDETQRADAHRFSAIVTFEDLGAHVENLARGKVTIKV
jgi:hypothetical protein